MRDVSHQQGTYENLKLVPKIFRSCVLEGTRVGDVCVEEMCLR